MSLSEISNLSINEIIAIVLGLLVGYWLISKFISSSKSDQTSNDQAKPQKTLNLHPSEESVGDKAWWEILRINQHASLPDIHRAYEELRMSYMPSSRDRSIPLSAETHERLQELDRAFRLALESKKTP
jgi:preprotein translocase subunit Sec63